MALNQSEDRFNGVVASLAIKAPCKAVSAVGNILLEGEQTVDTIAVVTGDRVLVIAQTDPVENGIYCANTGTWQRAADWDGNRDVAKGTIVNVNVPPNSVTSYVQLNLGVANDEPAIGIDPVNFAIFFSLNNSIDDLDDVDTTGCTDNDLMYWSGGVLICTLGDLTWDGVDLTINGNIEMPVLGAPRIINASGTVSLPNVLFNNLDPDSGIITSLDSMWLVTGALTAVNYRERSDHVIVTSEAHVGLTASTTQTQGGALELLSSYNQIETVANSGDAVRLPTAFQTLNQGRRMLIINDGANELQMFPTTNQDIGAGQDNPVTLAAGSSAYFVAVSNAIPSVNWRRIFDFSVSGPVGAFRGARAYSSVTINAPNNTAPDFDQFDVPEEAVVPLNSESFDTDSIHDNAVNNSRLTVPAGVTQVRLTAGYTQEGPEIGGLHHLRIRKNGSYAGIDASHGTMVPHMTIGASGSGSDKGMHMLSAGVINCVATDYFEIYILGQNNNTDSVANTIWLMMEVIK